MKKPLVIFIELKIASKNRFICDIVEKLYENDISTTIYTDNSKNAIQLDDLLWTWKQDSFIPHAVEGSGDESSHVSINFSPDNLPETQALVLNDPLPGEKLLSYDMIIDFAEIYHSDKKQASRNRYKQLRDSGNFELYFMQLGAFLARPKISLNQIQ